MNAAESARDCAESRGGSLGFIHPDDQRTAHGEAVVQLLPLVKHIVRGVGRRYRMGHDDIEELHSVVCLKLLSEEQAVLRKFEGRSGLSTYLTTVVTRVWLDLRIARMGKWRPSMAARRLGPAAMALERLIAVDGLTLHEASRVVVMNLGLATSDWEVRRIYEALPPRRPRRRLVQAAFLDDLPAPPLDAATTAGESPRVRAQLARVLRELPVEDQRLIVRRFGRGQTVAQIARDLRLDQKVLYRRYDRLFVRIRAVLGADASAPSDPVRAGVESGLP